MKILLKNANIVDRNKSLKGDIYIEEGIIRELGENLERDCETLDLKGLTLMPAFLDLHAHFRDPGFPKKETLETGSLAALRGGYTTVNLMANTWPIASNMEVVDYVLKKEEELDLIDVHQTVAVTNNFNGKSFEHLDQIDENKVRFISDDGKGIISNRVSYESMLIARDRGFIIMTHAEDMELTKIDYRMSENIISFRDLYLSQVTGARLHLAHVSTKEAIRAIRMAKEDGVNVTCEVTPHHIYMYDNDYRVNPPIREREDVEEIIRGIQDGTVDAIATDHAPHTEEEKKKGAPGISGIEVAFSLCYSKLVRQGHISLNRLSDLMSYGPARIFDVNKGLVEEGYLADLVVLDLDKEYEIDSRDFISKGKNTPLNGETVFGQPVLTMKAGAIKYKNKEYSI